MPIYSDTTEAGEPYAPSNGSEGEEFHAAWCERCERDKALNGTCSTEGRDPNDDDYCQILNMSFLDGGAKEWIYGGDGLPTCTAFVPLGKTLPLPRCDYTPDMF